MSSSLTYQCAFLTSLVEFERNTCTLLRSGILFLLQTVLNVLVRAHWQGPRVIRTAFHRQCGLLFTFQTGYGQNHARRGTRLYTTLHLQLPVDCCYEKLQVFTPLAQHMSHTSFDFQPRMQSIHLPREGGINNKFISGSAGRLATDAEAGSQART